jgi:putative addiction module component (TIGR02574 family)
MRAPLEPPVPVFAAGVPVGSHATVCYTRSMSTTTTLPDIASLSAAEKLRLIEELWDSLSASPDQLPVPEWHKAELDARHAEFEQGGVTLSLEEVDAQVLKALRSR